MPSLGETVADGNTLDWTELVLSWAAHHGRDLPWRHTRDPWAILVSEVMAQQTQVDRVIPKWHEFLDRWPTPHECAGAALGDVLRVWSGLGYPRRARYLHLAAQQIRDAGSFPTTLSGLMALPGVGAYTARALLAFAFEEDVAVVDTNTARVLARRANRALGRAEVQAAADAAVPVGRGWEWNQALLDLGAMICVRSSPRCADCPVLSSCQFGSARLHQREDLSDPANFVDPVDPADGTAGVSVAQSRFTGSDRQYRGAILRVAADGCQRTAVAIAIGLYSDPGRVDRLICALTAEGLVVDDNGVVRLPNE